MADMIKVEFKKIKDENSIKELKQEFNILRLTTVSRAPCRKFGWNCISLGSAPGSP